MIFAKVLKTPFLQNTSEGVLLNSDLCTSLVYEYQSTGLRMLRYTSALLCVATAQSMYVRWVLSSARSVKDCISVNRFYWLKT